MQKMQRMELMSFREDMKLNSVREEDPKETETRRQVICCVEGRCPKIAAYPVFGGAFCAEMT